MTENRFHFKCIFGAITLIFTLLFVYFTWSEIDHVRQALKAATENNLLKAVTMLEQRLTASYDQILSKEEGSFTEREKVLILQRALQPIVDDVAREWPDFGLGYYSLEQKIVALHPYREDMLGQYASPEALQVYRQKKLVFTEIQNGFTWGQGTTILSVNYPLFHDGVLIGHAWANVKIDLINQTIIHAVLKKFIEYLFWWLLLMLVIHWAAKKVIRNSNLLQTQLEDTKLLQTVSLEMLSGDNIQELCEKILDASMRIMRSEFASMQMLYPERGKGGELRLLAHRGFSPEAARFWEWVSPESGSACSAALRLGHRVVIPDINVCGDALGSDDLAIYNQTGIRAVQTTPLISRKGELVGMISTHWKKPYQPSERDFRLFDILVRQSADLIERMKAEEVLRESEEKERLLSSVARSLLMNTNPQEIINELCINTMKFLRCDVFFNYLADKEKDCLHLNAWGGIPQEEAAKLEWLPYGSAVCGCVARDGIRIVAENMSVVSDPRTKELKSFGIQAFACHPLDIGDQIIGTISFGTRSRSTFTEKELSVMKAVAEHVAIAFSRLFASKRLMESEQNAQRLVDQLLQADKNKNEFLAHLSHELRNPLAAIVMSAALLNKKIPEDKTAKKLLEVIERQSAQLSHLINDLLDVTRISRNKIVLKKECLELNGFIGKVVKDNEVQFADKGIRLEIFSAPTPIWLEADPARLTQILGNLLHNSLKFTKEGGWVKVSVTHDPSNRQGVIVIEDNGQGIEPDLLPLLFNPFIQADKSLDRSNSGLGLGLAIVKGIMDLHNGTVEAYSEGQDKGTRFILRLPIQIDGPPCPDTPAPIPSPSLGPLKILVIDDNKDMADGLCLMLQNGGHDVRCAYNGVEGLALAKEFQPQVLLCDIGLPGMDGYEVARSIRQDQELKDMFLITLTGYALPEDLERAREAGFQRHLAKPVSPVILKQVLAECFQAKNPRNKP